MIFGCREISAGTLVLPNNTALVRIWLKQDGSLESRTDATPPAAPAVYIGTATTSGGAITAVDQSGVCYAKGGMTIRDTADAGPPSDAPSSHTIFLTRTLAGTYLWDGSKYTRLASPMMPDKHILESGDSVYVPTGHNIVAHFGIHVKSGSSLTVKSGGKVLVKA